MKKLFAFFDIWFFLGVGIAMIVAYFFFWAGEPAWLRNLRAQEAVFETKTQADNRLIFIQGRNCHHCSMAFKILWPGIRRDVENGRLDVDVIHYFYPLNRENLRLFSIAKKVYEIDPVLHLEFWYRFYLNEPKKVTKDAVQGLLHEFGIDVDSVWPEEGDLNVAEKRLRAIHAQMKKKAEIDFLPIWILDNRQIRPRNHSDLLPYVLGTIQDQQGSEL